MRTLQYFWVNVFTNQQDKGNPLPVVILNQPLTATSMQQITKIFNQSETIFIEDAQSDLPKLHIYTPIQELPFAGHPIIGALEVLTKIRGTTPITQVLCQAGIVKTTSDPTHKIHWIKAPATPSQRQSTLDPSLTAKMLGITEDQILHSPVWINVGNEQLIVEIKDPAAIDSVHLNLPLFKAHAALPSGRSLIYLWAKQSQGIYARFLSLNHGALREDSGTGSAAANLGGWHLLQGISHFQSRIQQGTFMQRESILHLNVKNAEIWVGGENYFIGSGELYWQDPS